MGTNTILVIEDDRSLRLFLSINLQARGYEVLVTGNVATAWSDIQRFNPDLIILDLYLEEGNGQNLLAQLMSEGKRLPVILITGFCVEHALKEAYPNIIHILQKPFDLNQFLETVG